MQPDLDSPSAASDKAAHFRSGGADESIRPTQAATDISAAGGQKVDLGAAAQPATPSPTAKISAPFLPALTPMLSATQQGHSAPASHSINVQMQQGHHLTQIQTTVTLRTDQIALSAATAHVVQHIGGNANQNWATYVTGTATTATGQGLIQDSNGNVYVTGSTDEGTTKAAFVAKYDPTGNLIFFKKFQAKDVSTGITDNHSEGHAIGLDGNGNIYVTGKATNPTSRLQDAFIMRFDSSGAVDPTYGVGFDTGGLGNVSGNGLVVAADGTATLVGTARFFGNDIFLAVIGPDGSVSISATHAFAPGSFVDSQGQQVFTATVGNSIALNADGSLAYISGTGTHPGGDTDIMVMLVDTNSGGQSIAGFSYVPNAGTDSGNGIAVGADGTVYQAATSTIQSNGQSSTYATVIAWQGSLASANYGVYDQNTLTGSGIAVDPSGNAYLTGTATDLLGNTRALVDLLDPTGAVADTLLIADNGSGQESGAAVVYSQDGTAYLTGNTSSSNLSTDGSALNGDQDAFLANVGGFMF
jgi:hypothetical protein